MTKPNSVWVIETWDDMDKLWFPTFRGGFNLAVNARQEKKRLEEEWGDQGFKWRIVRYDSKGVTAK